MTNVQKLGFTLLGIFLFMMTFSSCTNKNDQYEKQVELNLIDTLEIELAKTRIWLDVNYPEIKSRINPMKQNIKIITLNYTETWSEEMIMNMDRYRGMLKIYEKFAEHYKPIVLETEELINQVKTLRNSVDKGLYVGKKEEFKKHYEQEKKDIENNLLYSTRYLKPAKVMEREYNRREEYVQSLLEDLK
jgi:hypothetical protein